MADDQDNPNGFATDDRDFNDLISRVYDVALDPLRMEDMVDAWEQSIAPLRLRFQDLTFLESGLVGDHVARAEAMLEKIGPIADGGSHADLLAQFSGLAAFVTDASLILRAVTVAAEQTLLAEVGAPITTLAIEPADLEVVAREIRNLLAAGQPTAPMLRVRAAKGQHIVIVHLRRVEKGDGSRMIVAACSELHLPDELGPTLREVFDLTPAESEIVLALIRGSSPQEVAKLRNRSPETIRGQIKTVLAKTETRNQVELTRLMMSMLSLKVDAVPPVETTDGNAAPHGQSSLARLPYHRLSAPAGRQIEYLILGNPEGNRPAIFCGANYGFQRWPASAEAEAHSRGLRVIVPIMPGYGGSDPIPKNVRFGRAVAEDIKLILDELKIDHVVAIAIAGAHTYISELERIRPGTVRKLVAAAGALPLETRAQFERMPKWHRAVQFTGKVTPRLLPFVVKAGFQLCRRAGAHRFLTSVYSASPGDLETTEDPEVLEAFEITAKSVTAPWGSAHLSYVQQVRNHQLEDQRDLLQWMSEKVPTHFVNGTEDAAMPADTIEELKPCYPNITFETIEDTGQLLFFKHWRYILNLLDESA